MLIGIVGAGVMGSGIAQSFVMEKGNQVILSDIDIEFARKGKENICQKLNSLVQKGKLSKAECDDMAERILVGITTDLHNCDLIIEAVKEDMAVKRNLFASLEQICAKETIFASNTSALSLSRMMEGMKRPIVGMHFFNPVPVMKLVEVIGAEGTPVDLLDQVIGIVEAIGKTPVRVKESSGFVVNRILLPMINEAIGVLSEEVASAADIDTAMKLGASHPIGPIALADLIGLDVCLAVMESLHSDLQDEKYTPHPWLKEMVAKGMLGRKTGSGFYNYKQ